MINQKEKLLIVYEQKDELAYNYLRKLIETNDDNNETGEIVGSKDNTISVIGWTEKVYLDNIKKKAINGKVIYLDDVKGTDNIAPIIDVRFDRFGICYGFAGKKALISIDENKIKSKEDFDEMKDYFESLSLENKTNQKSSNYPGSATKERLIAIALATVHPVLSIPFVFESIKTQKDLRDRMFIYAINKFYLEELDAFMKA